MKTNFWIVDDVQQATLITEAEKTNARWEVIEPASHKGQVYANQFCYKTQEEANWEVTDRHHRLCQNLEKRDLLGCLSIQKEPARKSRGYTQEDLEKKAAEDAKSYHAWVKKLKDGWREINHKEPNLAELARTLKNARLIQNALKNPLAADFTEIMAREAKMRQIQTPSI
jgi:hypothetical protein